MTRDADLVDQLKVVFRQAAISDSDRAMLEYVAKLTQAPWMKEEEDVHALREVGFSDAAILDINQVTGYYAYFNRLADGLGVELEAFWEYE